jgi:outer membrane protein
LYRARQVKLFWTERIASLEKDREVIASQVEAGRLRPLEVSLSRAALAGARQELLSSQERIGLAEVELRQLTGIPEGSAIGVVEPDLSDPSIEAPAEELYRRAAETHPEIRQADATLRARKLHIESVRGEKYPQLQLVSQYALFSRANHYQDYFNTFTRNNFLVGLSVQFPIFTGFRTEAQVSRSLQEAETARLRVERLKESLRLNIERSCSGFRMAKSAVEVAHEAAAAAGESLAIEESLLEAGHIGFREIQSARSQFAQKRLGELEAAKNLFDRKIELLRLTGATAQVLGK